MESGECYSMITNDEFDAIKSISSSNVRIEQINDVIKRIERCKKRLQLRFPSVFRDGVLLQFLTKFIKSNENIIHFACGLSDNYNPGFYALNEILKLPQIVKFNFRIIDLSFATPQFFDTLSNSNITKLYIKFDFCTDENVKLLCEALENHKYLKDLTFSCKCLTDEAVKYFAKLIGNKQSLISTLSISIDNFLNSEQFKIICDEGIKQQSSIQHLDIEDCIVNEYNMKILIDTLETCENIKTLTIGNNGHNAMKGFFKHCGKLKYVEKLICNESQLIKAEKVDLDLISNALNAMNKHNKLSVLQLPLFIFDDTTPDSLKLFVDVLSNEYNKIRILQLFPLFEHLDRASFQRDPVYSNKISYFFNLLFNALSKSNYLQKLYIEMIGSENNFFTPNVANSFSNFLINSQSINELYIPFCCLIELNDEILDSFMKCKKLISIKDDTMDYHWLDEDNPYISKYIIDEKKKQQLIKSKEYHQIAQKQCKLNIVNELIEYLPIKDLANLTATFCGFDANPEYWLIEEN